QAYRKFSFSSVYLKGIITVVIRLILPGILYFLKYSAAQLIQPRFHSNFTGKTAIFDDLPVKSSHPLRAKQRFLGFARKIQSPVTGKSAISGICP
ncbi:hypothetical protein, partial [Ligilactobacillus ruminis]|uniref:hypothetical protein n=1 Tax=Ligilactobacillus ruminis TaxID=1623 RepID=UPI0022E09EFE